MGGSQRLFLNLQNIPKQIHQYLIQCSITVHVHSFLLHLTLCFAYLLIIHDFFLFHNRLILRKFLQGCDFFVKAGLSFVISKYQLPKNLSTLFKIFKYPVTGCCRRKHAALSLLRKHLCLLHGFRKMRHQHQPLPTPKRRIFSADFPVNSLPGFFHKNNMLHGAFR